MKHHTTCIAVTMWLAVGFSPALAKDKDSVPPPSTLTTNGKTREFAHVVAAEIQSAGKAAVVVLFSEKPLPIDDATLLPEFFGIVFDSIEPVSPYVQVIFDKDTGKLMAFQGWAGNFTFQREKIREADDGFGGMASGELMRENARVSGKAKFNFKFSLRGQELNVEFNCHFDAALTTIKP